MKRLLILGAVLIVLTAAVLLSRKGLTPSSGSAGSAGVEADVEDRNPWTHLRLNNDPGLLRFAVVSDRTSGHRAGVFSRAVDQLNLLQPEFVLSVGDLIEGSSNPVEARAQWQELEGYVGRLQMPFFYAPGNHDIIGEDLTELWTERLGRHYYHFVCKGVLFVVLNAYETKVSRPDDPRSPTFAFGSAQLAWLKRVLADNAGVRWSFVCVHGPLWTYRDSEATGWPDVEKLLLGRQYTVFCGHYHNYRKYVRQGMNYYQLATTGGGSALRGPEYGEVDHVAWVTMRPDGPVVANLLLDGVLRDDMKLPTSDETGFVHGTGRDRDLAPVKGKVRYRGTVPAGATVFFTETAEKSDSQKYKATGRVEADGNFRLWQPRGAEGAFPGEYAVTVTWRDVQPDGTDGPNRLPPRYADIKTSGLKATVTRAGPNAVELELAE